MTDLPDTAMPRLVHFFEHLAPADLPQLATLYAADARFKDPFNEVQGVAAITAVFEHMFRTLDTPRFVVTGQVVQGRQALLTWDFLFNFKGELRTQTVRGATHLQFDAAGRVSLHRDYWDAAEELYEKLPVLGGLMRWVKRRLQAR
jgi:ketosteroid isomerase-like protein